MKKDTGLALSDIKGPLENLLNNLHGKHGDYWLEALKKMLRREELPELPVNLKKSFVSFDSRKRADSKLQEIVRYLKTIPVIHTVEICDESEDGDILNINVYPNLMNFIHDENSADDALFVLKMNHEVDRSSSSGENTDSTFETFCLDHYESLDEFCKAMIELGQKYEESIPKIPC